MFYLFKLSVLCHVLLTWAICWLDGSAPYFPIEVSRTATGKIGRYYFPLGFLLVGWVLWVESVDSEPRWLKLSPAVGVVTAAVINDELHWQAHLVGVMVAVGCVFANVGYETFYGLADAMTNQVLCAMACLFFWMSLTLKVYAVLDDPWDWHCWRKAMTIRRNELMEQCMDINYHGAGTRAQLVVYRVIGVCQWVALALLVNTY